MKNIGQARRVNIFVLIDALGWRLMKDRDFLSDILPYRSGVRTILGFSSGAIPTILTGLPPATTGHWNLFYYDPYGSPFRWLRHFRFVPKPLMDHRIMRRLIREVGRRILGLGPVFECCVRPSVLEHFNWVEKRNIYDHGGIDGTPSIFDELARKEIPHRIYSYHRWTDEEILLRVHGDLASSNARFFFVYLSELDALLHFHPRGGTELDRRLEWYGSELRGIFEQARSLDPEMTFTIFSDHGMTPVEHHFDLVGEVEKTGLRMPQDYLAVYDSTMARFWFLNELARTEITERLSALSCGRILNDAQLKELGVFFEDGRFGEVIFLLNPGWLVAQSDFNGAGWRPTGMHGYHPDDPDSDAVFLSNRRPPVAMRSIVDMYRCMKEVA